MAANATAVSPARPPENSVWIRYHPWIEGVTAHIGAWSIHLLVIGGAALWFWYLAYALGFTRPLRSLPVQPVRLEPAGGLPVSTEAPKRGKQAARLEGAVGQENPDPKASPLNESDPPQLTPVTPLAAPPDFQKPGDRPIHQNMDAIEKFRQLNEEAQTKLRRGLGEAGTKGVNGQAPAGGREPGMEEPSGEREKRMRRWSLKFNTQNGTDYLRQLQVLGTVLAVPSGPNSFEVVDLTKKPFRAESKDISTIQKIWWIDNDPRSVGSLMQAMRLTHNPGVVIAFIPQEVEDELAKKELAYQHLDANDIFSTTFKIRTPGTDGRKYDLEVAEQKAKRK